MANYVYYHNPRCTKSRQGLAFLMENDIEVDIREYLKVPLDVKEISGLLDALGFANAFEMVRTKEQEFTECGLTKTSSNSDVFKTIVAFPKLLERPILTNGKNAAIGRPLENIQKLVGL